ncbi:tyrosine-type recombinase/integrase [Flavobacterium sp. LC2016-23]|uniref:tyrosine-type recombinase/integrase n=1 Tax=Flavobacterium sp. LC2016-23 TaxID=2666330 RepID=UPI0012B120A6|nr:site-specific integrase [Flavobacterium sp. LC2016-23]MRX40563.1 tyrosine-type recombinase/integrase [Flavobacterium sp. LC2016-23]
MQNSQVRRVSSLIFVDFKPAELKMNKEWIIVFYSKNPITNKLERFRHRVPTMESRPQRLKLAKSIVAAINLKLAAGWSPFLEQVGSNYKTFEDAIDDFLASIKKQIKDNVLRPDTLRTYNSNINLLKLYFQEKKIKIVFALELKKHLCVNYLDWIYIERNSSPRTRNNHLAFLRLFSAFLIGRGILNENPTMGIQGLKPPAKERQIIPEAIKQRIYEEFQKYKDGYPALCMSTYFCFIRNSELGKLKIWMLNFEDNSIFLPKEISKNKKDESVTIPAQFLNAIKNHVGDSPKDYYVFSNNQFKPGLKKMTANKIGNAWEVLRVKLNLESKYQFYSLKDTGITDLLNSGVPAIKVRDQARHSEIKITEMYAIRKNTCDSIIQQADISFGVLKRPLN